MAYDRRPTAKQQAVIDFLRAYIADRGYPPSWREIMAHFEWTSTNTASDNLRALERKGLLVIDRMRRRGIRLLGEPDSNGAPPQQRLPPGRIWLAYGIEGQQRISVSSVAEWIPCSSPEVRSSLAAKTAPR
jgi:SOS-response transcriptional repressor LexA